MKGFTIFELLIVIGILAVASGFAILNLFGYRRYQDLNLTTQEIAAVLRNAQNRSMAQEFGGPWGVHFENGVSEGSFYKLFLGQSYATSTVYSTAVLRPSVEFSDPGIGNSKNVFFKAASGLGDADSQVRVSLRGSSSVSSTIYIYTNGRIDY